MNGALLVLIVLTAAITVAGAAGLVVYYRRYRRFRGRVQTAPAVIGGIRQATFGIGGRPPYLARVSFTTPAGQAITTEVRLYNAAWGARMEPFGSYAQVGMQVWVDFDPANPQRAELNPEASRAGSRPRLRWPQRLAIGWAAGLAMFVLTMAVVIATTM